MSNKLISFFRRKILRIKKDRWDYQYTQGQWETLRSEEELQRIYVAHDLLKKHHKGKNILEIGCGEGIFFSRIDPALYEQYEGIDISEAAIQKISSAPKSFFRVADMETYEPEHSSFETIIMNEVLCYTKDPVKLVKRYEQYLSKDGVFLLGLYKMPGSDKMWKNMDAHFTELESAIIKQSGKEWIYKVMRPGK